MGAAGARRRTGTPAGAAEVVSYAQLARWILAAPPRLGSVRLVAVDGAAGSGKSTFARRLARALDAPVLHTDDLLDGWRDLVTFWPRLTHGVLDPLRQGRPGRYRRYDWLESAFSDEWTPVPVPDVLLLEGVSSARRAIRSRLSYALWIEAEREVRLARGLARDGATLRPEWVRWQAAEDVHFAADETINAVDLVVDGDPAPGGTRDPEREFVRWRP